MPPKKRTPTKKPFDPEKATSEELRRRADTIWANNLSYLGDRNRALEYYEQAVIKERCENTEEVYLLAVKLDNCSFVARDEEVLKRALHFYGIAANQNHPDSCHYLGQHYQKEGDIAIATAYYEKAVYLGFHDSKMALAKILLRDHDCLELDTDSIPTKDKIRAIALLKEAAAAGVKYATESLAKCYTRGIGVEKSEENVKKWEEKGKKLNGGHTSARTSSVFDDFDEPPPSSTIKSDGSRPLKGESKGKAK